MDLYENSIDIVDRSVIASGLPRDHGLLLGPVDAVDELKELFASGHAACRGPAAAAAAPLGFLLHLAANAYSTAHFEALLPIILMQPRPDSQAPKLCKAS